MQLQLLQEAVVGDVVVETSVVEGAVGRRRVVHPVVANPVPDERVRQRRRNRVAFGQVG